MSIVSTCTDSEESEGEEGEEADGQAVHGEDWLAGGGGVSDTQTADRLYTGEARDVLVGEQRTLPPQNMVTITSLDTAHPYWDS